MDEHVEDPLSPEPPVRVCRKCSTQSQTGGEFCPQCGVRFATRRRSRSARALLIGVPIVLILAGGGVAAALIIHHNDQIAAQKRAVVKRQAEAQAQARQLQLAQQQQASALKVLTDAQRTSIVSALQDAVKKDAQHDVNNGVLTGPILKVQCQPASSTDATANIATYTCIGANSIASDGTLSGYRFTATINVNSGTYSWHLGG